jgi:hypothetical protein
VAAEAFKPLKDLGKEKMAAIDSMLTKGIVASQVAALIKDEWKALPGVKVESVKKMLERYRKSELRQRIVDQVAGTTAGLRASTLQKKASAMDMLQELVEIQTGRFKKMLVKEQPTPLLMKQVSDEGRLLKEMLVELGRLQLETGVLARAPKKVTGQVTDASGQVSTFEWTQEQDELFKSIESGPKRGDSHVTLPG